MEDLDHNLSSPIFEYPSSDVDARSDGGAAASEVESASDSKAIDKWFSAWRRYTGGDIRHLERYDLVRANDLSIHLYNAHAAKQAQYEHSSLVNLQPWQNKTTWLLPGAADGWAQPGSWTTWPLSADDVPRIEEGHCKNQQSQSEDETIYRKTEDWRPSIDLEDELLALILRTAQQRSRESGPPNRVDAPSAQKDTDRSVEYLINAAQKSACEASSTLSHIHIDDDQARLLLEPSIQNTIAALDKLLLALHKSRKGHSAFSRDARNDHKPHRRSNKRARVSPQEHEVSADESTDSASAAASDADEEETGAEEDPSHRPMEVHENYSSTQAPLNRQKRTASMLSSDPDENVINSRAMYRRYQLPAPRDWSEVLGIAAMVGWDKDVVLKSARRCAALFGESMDFRTMPDPASENQEQVVQASAAATAHSLSAAASTTSSKTGVPGTELPEPLLRTKKRVNNDLFAKVGVGLVNSMKLDHE